MSLFTVLKYGNTDMSNATELSRLPKPLINEFYERVTGHDANAKDTFPSLFSPPFTLAVYWNTGGVMDATEYTKTKTRETMRRVFIKLLEEWEDE